MKKQKKKVLQAAPFCLLWINCGSNGIGLHLKMNNSFYKNGVLSVPLDGSSFFCEETVLYAL